MKNSPILLSGVACIMRTYVVSFEFLKRSFETVPERMMENSQLDLIVHLTQFIRDCQINK